MSIIPFYGAEDRDLFAIERATMDRPGKVLAALDALLPPGRVLDIGAGDGYTALRLSGPVREVVALEPAAGMIERSAPLAWVQGVAQYLPFAGSSFDAAFATWAYFFPGYWDISPGLAEVSRVVRQGGQIVIVDNAGDDELTALAPSDITADLGFWRRQGFDVEIVETAFVFETLDDARRLCPSTSAATWTRPSRSGTEWRSW